MDDRLRQLERAARADPDDLAAGRALVRALDQAGDAVGAWQARCRLARAGDEGAWVELAPLPGGAREAGQPVERSLEGRVAVDADARTVLVAGSSLAALDPATLEPRWSVEGQQAVAALLGPFALHVPAASTTLVLRDALGGDEVARTALPAPAAFVDATRDRVIVICEHSIGATTVVIDLGDQPGAPLAVRPDVLPFRAARGAGRGLRLVREHGGIADIVEARDADTDAVRWRTRDWLLHGSDLGFLVMTGPRPRRVLELDPRRGEPRWTATLDAPQGGVGALLTPEVAILSTQAPPWTDEARRFNVAAFERVDGTRRWVGGDEDLRWNFVQKACAATSVYFIRSPDEGPSAGECRLEARDLRTGEPAWSRPLGSRRGEGHSLHAVDGGVVASWHGDGTTTLLRLGSP